MKTIQEILLEVFTPTGLDCQTVREDLRLSIALNPSLELIEDAVRIGMKEAIEACIMMTPAKSKEEHDIKTSAYRYLINELK